jgi:hypothetical protein
MRVVLGLVVDSIVFFFSLSPFHPLPPTTVKPLG